VSSLPLAVRTKKRSDLFVILDDYAEERTKLNSVKKKEEGGDKIDAKRCSSEHERISNNGGNSIVSKKKRTRSIVRRRPGSGEGGKPSLTKTIDWGH